MSFKAFFIALKNGIWVLLMPAIILGLIGVALLLCFCEPLITFLPTLSGL